VGDSVVRHPSNSRASPVLTRGHPPVLARGHPPVLARGHPPVLARVVAQMLAFNGIDY